MKFISTRGEAPAVSFTEAVAQGLAPDGGLYLPEFLPDLTPRLRVWGNLSYAELATEFLGIFASDIPPEDLARMVHRAYATFTHPEIAPLRRLDERTAVLELFHGPTLAFKDFALQFLGQLHGWQGARTGRSINVLGATSGDTGAAAIHGLLGRPRTAIFILYPDGRVSPLQERQMACTGADNVHALALDGSFDDAQRLLKAAFNDHAFAARHRLTAVNSINLARILAQCVYYLHAWLRLTEEQRERLEFVVPTGNFGNVFAGWLLTRMGVPIPGFKVATNRNDILHRFFVTGEYRVGAVEPSLAPSMDIQAASNFERLLHYLYDEDAARVRAAMAELAAGGRLAVPGVAGEAFRSTTATDADIAANLRRVSEAHGYVADPHTACAFQDLDPARYSVVLATAHPAKFPEAMRAAIGSAPTHPALEELKSRPLRKHRLPADLAAVQRFIAEHAVP